MKQCTIFNIKFRKRFDIPILRHYTYPKALGEKKISKKRLLIKKFTSTSNLIVVNNTANFQIYFIGQTSLKDTIFLREESFDKYIFLSNVNLFNLFFP